MKKVFLIGILMMICFFTAPCLLRAQDDGFPDDPGEPDVPFDSGVSLLVMLGVAYGAVKTYELKHRKGEIKKIKKAVITQQGLRRKMNRLVRYNKLNSGISFSR